MAVLLVGAATAGVWYAQATFPRCVVLASGVKDASYHIDAQRYAELLARDGVTVVDRMTGGAADNAALLLDPKSGVDAGFMEDGVLAEHIRIPASHAQSGRLNIQYATGMSAISSAA